MKSLNEALLTVNMTKTVNDVLSRNLSVFCVTSVVQEQYVTDYRLGPSLLFLLISLSQDGNNEATKS
jgi:hypothetical protein